MQTDRQASRERERGGGGGEGGRVIWKRCDLLGYDD